MTDHRFVFVSGLHRSGTSILFKSLRDHPEISGFQGTNSPEDEGMHLQTVYKPSGYYGGAGEFGFHAEAHLTDVSPLVSEANREKLFFEWARYWNLGKKYLLEKSPPNLIRTRFLQAMFPDSYFIVLMRHPLAVTYATHKWHRQYGINWRRFSRILEHWLVCHEIFLADRSHLQNAMLVKYEDFVADPNNRANSVYSFLGIKDHPIEQKILSSVNEKYFTKWRNDLNGFFTGPLRRPLIERYEERFRSFGYSLVDFDWTA